MKSVMFVTNVLAAMLVGAFAVPAQADECDKLTYVTFSVPVALPDVNLPPGTYRFTRPDCSLSNHVLRVSSQDGTKVYATLLTIPADRPEPSNQATVVFAETPTGAPEPIKAWFYPGETTGDELVYRKGEARGSMRETERFGGDKRSYETVRDIWSLIEGPSFGIHDRTWWWGTQRGTKMKETWSTGIHDDPERG